MILVRIRPDFLGWASFFAVWLEFSLAGKKFSDSREVFWNQPEYLRIGQYYAYLRRIFRSLPDIFGSAEIFRV